MSNSAARFCRSKRYTARKPLLASSTKHVRINHVPPMEFVPVAAIEPEVVPEETIFDPLWWVEYASPAAFGAKLNVDAVLDRNRSDGRPMIHVDFGSFNYEAPERQIEPLEVG